MGERQKITEIEYVELAEESMKDEDGRTFHLSGRIINFKLLLPANIGKFEFHNCEFQKPVQIFPARIDAANVVLKEGHTYLNNDLDDKHFEDDIVVRNPVKFVNCQFHDLFLGFRVEFKSAWRLHNCTFYSVVNFHEATFLKLADFWRSTFKKPTTFYKTDFNATAVFSMATFEQNVLFTYSLLAGKTIFSKTEFKKGLDLSQAIISGDLKLFDIHFENDEFQTKYFKRSEKAAYQDAIDNRHIIPTENKAHTFQILRKAYEDVGNYDDATKMRKAEKAALRELNYEKLGLGKMSEIHVPIAENKLISWFKEPYRFIRSIEFRELLSNDGFILYLNRRSNRYRSNFWTGVWFTCRMVVLFSFLTIILTSAFWEHLPWIDRTTLDYSAIKNGIKFIINFFNPVHRITYLDALNPYLGLAYITDFLGRIFVGFGIYQTIQAFRKFK